MKYLYTLSLVLINTFVWAQTIKVKVISQETQQAIPHITVFNEDSSFFITSNQKGELILDADKVLNTTLYIDDFSFETSEKTIDSVKDFDWILKPNAETLEELVIYTRPIKDLLLEVIDHSVATFSKNKKVEAFYRENYKKNDKVETFSEGLMDFYIGNNLKNVNTIVKQSRNVDVTTDPNDTLDMSLTLISKPEDLIETSMRFKFLKNLVKDKNYEFVVKSKKVGDRLLHTCYIQSKPDVKKSHLYKGYFVFDEQKKLILETNFAFEEEKKQYNSTINLLIAKFDFLDLIYKTKYFDSDKLYYPTYARLDYDLIVNSKMARISNRRLQSSSYFYTLDFVDTTEVPKKEDLYTLSSLYSRGTKYGYEFWTDDLIRNLSE